VVFILARLLATTSVLYCCAIIPDAAIRNAFIGPGLLLVPVFAFSHRIVSGVRCQFNSRMHAKQKKLFISNDYVAFSGAPALFREAPRQALPGNYFRAMGNS